MSSDSAGTSPAPKSFARTPTSWDAQDDILLMHLKDTQKLGWKEIASHFHNRTPNACQFRWRRLKSGNLKNPPKSAVALGGLAAAAVAATSPSSSLSPPPPKKPQLRRPSDSQAPLFLPIANATFTGYEMPAIPPISNVHSSINNGNRTGSASGPSGPVNTTSHPQTFELPRDVVLDPQTHSAAAAAAGGYFTEILVDPTLNLPHNKPHPAPALTPRASVDHVPAPLHRNSVIQIRDDRNLVLLRHSILLRHLVLSLPLKSMNIPHHRQSMLLHIPVLFGGTSVSGPSGSVLGPPMHWSHVMSSVRNGSITKRDEKEKPSTPEKDKKDRHESPRLAIPWSMEEDELLINRRRKELSFAELLILLPQRTEGEIWGRIDALERLRNGPRADRRRGLLVGLDDVEDLYLEVDSVIGVDSDEDVLVDVDDAMPAPRRGIKRRASSAVNPREPRKI